MRYKFLLQLYSLRFDKHEFERDFGVSVERGLPVEMAFMDRRLNGAFATDNADELTLTPAGRYLVVVLYRQYLAGLNNLREQARSELTGVEHDLLFGDEHREGWGRRRAQVRQLMRGPRTSDRQSSPDAIGLFAAAKLEEFLSGVHTAFHVDMLDVGLERARSDKQLAFDLGVRLPPGDEAHDLVLSGD